MQFNSFEFILYFLPIVVIMYFLSNKIHYSLGKVILIGASIIFYAIQDWSVLIMLGISLIINFAFSKFIEHVRKWNKFFMLIPVVINVGLLLYFKYTNFVITNINTIFAEDFALKEIILPIGISFFTFQQIAYIVAVYKKEVERVDVIDYLAYILFFPKMLMGPLMEPVDFMSQLNDESKKVINADNLTSGIQIFSFGLFKKVMIADVFAAAVTWGYTNIEVATSVDWILVMLFYTFEIYFDFSGYSDMAVGASLLLNISLPINFDSPYKALSIRDFWKRWHISLTKFFTNYIYIPIGGSRKGIFFTCVNTMIIFLISGIWHGANWTFILWGILHGIFMVLDKVLEKFEVKVFEPVRWWGTFTVVNVLWLLFRSETIEQWNGILETIVSFKDTNISEGLMNVFVLQETTFLRNVLHLGEYIDGTRGFWMWIFILGAFGICLIPENNYKNCKKKTVVSVILASIAFVWGIMSLSGESTFVYFNF